MNKADATFKTLKHEANVQLIWHIYISNTAILAVRNFHPKLIKLCGYIFLVCSIDNYCLQACSLKRDRPVPVQIAYLFSDNKLGKFDGCQILRSLSAT